MAKDNKELAKEANLRSLYTELNKFGQNGEYEKALKTVNRSNKLLYQLTLLNTC